MNENIAAGHQKDWRPRGPSAAILAGVTVSACGVLSARTPTSWIAHVLARIGERGRANKRGVRALEEVAIRP
jgi:hypothetical protein